MRTMTLLVTLVLLGACATTTPRLGSDVSTYSQWAPGRRPATYAFEPPSQEPRAERQQQLEDAARGALETAGFTEADGNNADVIVQIGARARTTRTLHSSAATRHRPRMPPDDLSNDNPAYVTTDLREVALLIRERESGHALYGARATNRGRSVSDPAILAAMFEATMKDFPNASVNPRQVTIELGR